MPSNANPFTKHGLLKGRVRPSDDIPEGTSRARNEVFKDSRHLLIFLSLVLVTYATAYGLAARTISTGGTTEAEFKGNFSTLVNCFGGEGYATNPILYTVVSGIWLLLAFNGFRHFSTSLLESRCNEEEGRREKSPRTSMALPLFLAASLAPIAISLVATTCNDSGPRPLTMTLGSESTVAPAHGWLGVAAELPGRIVDFSEALHHGRKSTPKWRGAIGQWLMIVSAFILVACMSINFVFRKGRELAVHSGLATPRDFRRLAWAIVGFSALASALHTGSTCSYGPLVGDLPDRILLSDEGAIKLCIWVFMAAHNVLRDVAIVMLAFMGCMTAARARFAHSERSNVSEKLFSWNIRLLRMRVARIESTLLFGSALVLVGMAEIGLYFEYVAPHRHKLSNVVYWQAGLAGTGLLIVYYVHAIFTLYSHARHLCQREHDRRALDRPKLSLLKNHRDGLGGYLDLESRLLKAIGLADQPFHQLLRILAVFAPLGVSLSVSGV